MKNIVVVDDNQTSLETVELMLQDKYEVTTIPSGEKLLEILPHINPDMILLDINMPSMSGYDVIKKIKSDEKLKDCPVIFLTSLADDENEYKGLSLGAFDYFSKPFSAELLLKRIDNHIALFSQRKELVNAREHTQKILDTMPLSHHLWSRDHKLLDCNEEALKLVNIKTKQEYIDKFFQLSPEYQPDGQLSREKAISHIDKAFAEGRCVFEYMHQMLDGTPLPAEVTLVKLNLGSEDVVAGYVQDLRESKRMIGEIEEKGHMLQEALDDAQEANKAKSSFLANMSHEMRTPLNAIIGFSFLALEKEDLDEDEKVNLEKIHTSAKTLLDTINEILDISKVEAGKFDLVPVEYDTPSLINDAVTQSIMRKGDKPIQFVLNLEDDFPSRLYGDELRIKQVFNNLLSNALKYTRIGTVEFSLKSEVEDDAEHGKRVWITAAVRDTGMGIHPDLIDKLFSEFTQMDTKANRKIEGTGLGLAITKKMVELMGGDIRVESEYGKGSIFTVKIPQKFVNDELIGKEIVDSLKNFQYLSNKLDNQVRFKRLNMSYANVLVVDDVATNLDVARGLLKPYKLQVDCVLNGQAAVDAVRAESVRYNAIFMDHMMPDMDGVEATRIIREEIGTEYAKTVPIIALTANAIVGTEKMFLEHGFQAFVTKPIETKSLDAALRQWVRNEELEKNLESEVESDSEERRSGKDRRVFTGKIEGVDIKKGLKVLNGDIDAYLQVLRTYALNTPSLIETARTITDDKGAILNIYTVTVHGLKSSSRGIGAEAVGGQAEALEHAAKAGNLEFVNQKNQALIDALTKLVANIKEALEQVDANKVSAEKEKKDKPDRELLSKLLVACNNLDMEEVDNTIAELDAFEYSGDDGLVQCLKDDAMLMKYAEMAEKITGILKQEGV